MPKAKPAIQWALLIFVTFWIVHDPVGTAGIVGDVFSLISQFFHQIGGLFTFHSNT